MTEQEQRVWLAWLELCAHAAFNVRVEVDDSYIMRDHYFEVNALAHGRRHSVVTRWSDAESALYRGGAHAYALLHAESALTGLLRAIKLEREELSDLALRIANASSSRLTLLRGGLS